MSLAINDPRSRGRSKSPGGRDRSRSRDARAPSPAAPPARSSKTKKYYESDSTEESSDSESDHRSSRRRHEETRYAEVDPRRRPAAPAVPQPTTAARGGRYEEAPDPRYERDPRDGRHPSYVDPAQYDHTRPAEYGRHPSYSKTDAPTVAPIPRPEYAPPGSYKREYDHPEVHEKNPKPPPHVQNERDRGISLSTSGSFHVDIGHGHSPHPQYAQPVPPTHAPGYTQSPPHGYYQAPQPTAPDYSRTHSGSITAGRQHYEVPEKYKYAEPPQQITYVNKSDARKPSYTQTSYTQIEIDERHQPSRHPSEVEVDLERKPKHRQEVIEIDEVDIDLGHHKPARRQQVLEIEDRKVVRRPSRHEEIEIEERRPSRHNSEVEIDMVRRQTEYDRRRTSQSHGSSVDVVEVRPGGGRLGAPPSPGLGPRMHRLSVSAGGAGALSLSAPGHHSPSGHGPLPPGSPLLEAYHGTYQSMSPMPSPLMLSSKFDDGLSDLEPLDGDSSSDSSRGHRKPKKSILVVKKHVSIYDPEKDALALAAALNHHTPKNEPIIAILPHLSDDHMMALRTEYKKHIKVGGKGINIAKHIKLKVQGNLGKIAYATALGRWESEAHWANFWYQSGSSRRELLIESLMGRTNSEIRAIKEAFSDKRYNDSLEKCMQQELKKDKFRDAVLLALEEKRMDETTAVMKSLVRKDVDDLYKALVSKEGGETAMLKIVVIRSDMHMRDVLREFELRYRKNFAREMIQKSKNLVVSIPLAPFHPHIRISPLSIRTNAY